MELIYLRGSTWTVSLLWAIGYSGSYEKVHRWTEHTPLLGELRLRWKARTLCPSEALTVPMLVSPQGRMMNHSALESAQILCSPSVFPPGKAAEIGQWYAKADAVCRFARNVSFTVDENLLENMSPEAPAFIGVLLKRMMKRKYKETNLEVQRNEAKKNLREVAALVESSDQKHPVFLLGTATPTFADFIWAVTLESMLPEFDIVITKFLPKCNKRVQELLAPTSFAADFASLFRWKKMMLQKCFIGNSEVAKLKQFLTLPDPSVTAPDTQ